MQGTTKVRRYCFAEVKHIKGNYATNTLHPVALRQTVGKH